MHKPDLGDANSIVCLELFFFLLISLDLEIRIHGQKHEFFLTSKHKVAPHYCLAARPSVDRYFVSATLVASKTARTSLLASAEVSRREEIESRSRKSFQLSSD